MRISLTLAILAIAGFLGGCVSPYRGKLVLAPVGPPPLKATPTGSEGSLVVFSAFDTAPDVYNDPYRHEYSNYRIFATNGKLLNAVHNDNGRLLERPREVPLPVGAYRVVARANGYGVVTVPVVIRPGQRTVVHLEGSPTWVDGAAMAQSDPVRLPHGEIAGWRAGEDNQNSTEP